MKVPSGYSSNIVKLVLVKVLKMNFAMMKSHVCHVMMMSLLVVAIMNILPIKVREAILSLGFFFNAIEQKVLDPDSLEVLERRHFETIFLRCISHHHFSISWYISLLTL